MTETEPAFDRSTLLTELQADCEVNGAILERVRQRVATTVTSEHLAALGTTNVAPQPALPKRLVRASWLGLAAALAVGTSLGAGGHALVSAYFSPQHAHVLAPPRRAPNESTPRPVAPVTVVSESPDHEPAPEPATQIETAPRLPAPKPSADPGGIDAELQQLDQARGALAGGQPARALSILSAHAARHPRSMLAQERDALTVKALVAVGRHAEARAAGERFTARYPNGLLLDTVKASLATIP